MFSVSYLLILCLFDPLGSFFKLTHLFYFKFLHIVRLKYLMQQSNFFFFFHILLVVQNLIAISLLLMFVFVFLFNWYILLFYYLQSSFDKWWVKLLNSQCFFCLLFLLLFNLYFKYVLFLYYFFTWFPFEDLLYYYTFKIIYQNNLLDYQNYLRIPHFIWF